MVHGVGEKNAQPTWLVSSLVRLVQCGFREQFRRSSSRLPSPPCAPFFERQPSRKIRLGMAWEARFVAGGGGDLVAVPVHAFDPAAARPRPTFPACRMHGALPSDCGRLPTKWLRLLIPNGQAGR